LKTKVYHNIDITLRMRVLGLGSPDKVPPLTEKAAIELGGDILADIFVFGTAAGAILLEYMRQSKNTENKSTAMSNKVVELEENYNKMIKQLEESNKRVNDMAKFVQDQKTKIEDLNNKLNKLDNNKNKKFATQGVQTTNGRQIGKVMHPKKSDVSASKDVTNSIIYQVAEKAVEDIKSLVK
jgi:hypothetical protein